MDLTERIKRKLRKPVVMTGLMGSGKSRIGRMLADRLELEFVDSDTEIEAAAGCSIPDIFERFGEKAFRDAEEKIIIRLLKGGVRIIATGGGALMNPKTAQTVWEKAVSVWLRADIPLLVTRTAENPGRPLLRRGNPEDVLRELMALREPVYRKASVIVDSEDVPCPVTVDKVLEGLDDVLR